MRRGPACRFLEWDSEFFGRRIARVTASPLSDSEARQVLAWARAQRIDCLYLLVDADDPVSIRSAEDSGFRLVDVRLTLQRYLRGHGSTPAEPSVAIRPCKPADVPELRRIARVSHRDSRFYCDPRFPDAQCDALYDRWIERRCAEDAGAVLVGEYDGKPSGYLVCQLDSDDSGRIDLVAVDAEARATGLGTQLVAASLRWFAEAGRERALVVTQGRNAAGLRLYGALGFTTQSVELWYHLWPSEAGERVTP